jgi:hypothetical protein
MTAQRYQSGSLASLTLEGWRGKRLRRSGAQSMNDLLDLNDIAARWKVKREYAQRYLVKRPEFPEPAPGSTRKLPRWRVQDIERFIRGEQHG